MDISHFIRLDLQRKTIEIWYIRVINNYQEKEFIFLFYIEWKQAQFYIYTNENENIFIIFSEKESIKYQTSLFNG